MAIPPRTEPPPKVVVFGDRARAGRTLRALGRLDLAPIDATITPPPPIPEGPLWLVRAGAWPLGSPSFPPPSATGRPLVAMGAIVADDDVDDAEAWRDALARTGGDLSRAREIPPIASAYVDAAIAAHLARDARDTSIEAALRAAIAATKARVVRVASLDVRDDPRLRVALAITSLQQGGAERVVIDLHEELFAIGLRPIIAVTGRPTRAAFAAPDDIIDVSRVSARREHRVASLADAAVDEGADLIHAHLLSGDDLALLAERAIPIAVTVHNTREGWPEGLASVTRDHVSLFIACSLAAERDLADLPVPSRVAWNGIDVARLRATPSLRAKGAAFRRDHGLREGDLVMASIANPRPQKRLHLLPEVLAEAQKIHGDAVALVIAGDADPRTEPARSSAAAIREAIDRAGVADRVRLVGSIDDPAPLLAAADVLVSVSAHEGLSLAHLEALAAGVPVVATDAGGTREIAPNSPAIAVLPRDAAPAEIAAAAIASARERPAGARAIAEGFSRRRMAERHAWLYPRVIAASRRARGEGLLLVTNNLSTGGAQSSARRLLTILAAEGTRARAAVIEEQAAYPTPGRRALERSGVPVLALPDRANPAESVARLLAWIDEDPPAAVLLWNALAPHKISIADALLDVPVFDVSPGEMTFASLDRYFQKPLAGLPYRDARAYGSRLAGVIVKFEAERARAAEALGAPVHVIPNGVVIPPRATRAARSSGRVVIGTAARLSPQKKLEALFDALRLARPSMPPYELRVAGGPERGSEAYAEALRERAGGLDVTWIGEVEDTSTFLSELDLFAMISEPAGCPNASLEAMAAGLPVIATDVGGASEQVLDGVTGRLVPRDDPRALADAIVDLARDPERARRLGDAGRARAEARFDVRRMAADYRRVVLAR